MSAITMTCRRCGASITTADVKEAIGWDVTHDEVCANRGEDD